MCLACLATAALVAAGATSAGGATVFTVRERRPGAVAMVESRLAVRAGRLGARDHLEDRFSAGDRLTCRAIRSRRQAR